MEPNSKYITPFGVFWAVIYLTKAPLGSQFVVQPFTLEAVCCKFGVALQTGSPTI